MVSSSSNLGIQAGAAEVGPTTSQLLDKVLLLILCVLKDEEALMDSEGLVFLWVFDDKGFFGYKSDDGEEAADTQQFSIFVFVSDVCLVWFGFCLWLVPVVWMDILLFHTLTNVLSQVIFRNYQMFRSTVNL